MIRPAQYIDNLQLPDLLEDMYERSVYNGRLTLDYVQFKKIIVASISQHGKKSCCFVSEVDGKIDGFIVGVKDTVYGVSKEYFASDLFFYTKKDSSIKAGMGLFKAFLDWAENAEDVVEVVLGITDAIGDYDRLAEVYKSKGFRQDGVMMTKEIR